MRIALTQNPLDAERILVVTKFRFLGDNIWATAFLRRLRESASAARVTLLSGPLIPTLLKGCPNVDEIWAFDRYGGGGLRSNLELIRRIRRGGFQTAFLLNRSIHSAAVVAAARIPIRIGYDTEHRGALLTVRVPFDWTVPERGLAMSMLRAAGVETVEPPTELWISAEESEAALELLESRGARSPQLLVGIQAGAHDPYVREWGAERFARVADHLVRERGATIVLLGAGEERAVSDRVAEVMEERPLVLTGETDLRLALAVISHCRLWIGNDGGLLHAAVALGAATVGIFGPTKAGPCGYATARHRTVVAYPDQPTGNPDVIRKCLDSISCESVYEAAMGALAAESLVEA